MIRTPRTLRGRLTAAYALAVLVALIVFAALSLLVLHEVQRRALDARLQTAERAVAAVVPANDGPPNADPADVLRLSRIAGAAIGIATRSRAGTIVSTTTHVPRVVVVALASSGEGFRDASAEGEALRVFVATAEGGVRIASWTSPESVGDALTKTALAFALLIPLVVVLVALAGTAIAARALLPLRSLAEVAAEIEARDLSRRIAVPAENDELSRLCATFDRMLDRLEAAFDRERRFTADVSHELRAPLSIIRAEGDLALAQGNVIAEYRAAIAAMIREADHLELLTEDLLEAARAHIASPRRDVGDVAELVGDAVHRMQPLARRHQIRLTVGALSPADIDAPLEAVERAVIAVLHNALKHTPDGGQIHVELRTGDADATLTIHDGGSGFSPDALHHAFDRFWRGSDGSIGSGLGLAIAHEALQDAGGSIALSNGDSGGIVTIRLARAENAFER
ncbi:MAG: hypothetical protein NVS3B7_07970 [Candidatus Elarobacter sp.]